jgi:hypothetical protein
MTPIVGGNMYPELHKQILDPRVFHALILSELTAEHLFFLSKIEVLHNYIQEKIGDQTRIQIHALKAPKPNKFEAHQGVELHELKSMTPESIAELVHAADIDAILDVKQLITDKKDNEFEQIVSITTGLDALEAECETFLVGRNIPWTFMDAMWNMTWFARYYARPGLCRDCYNFMLRAGDEHQYTSEQVERVRYLTNRIGQIDYCRDVLNSYLQRKRRAKRNGSDRQDYSFELNYHLSNYFFLISGGLDIIARILNDVFSLGIIGFGGLGLEKEDLTEALAIKQPDIAKLYKVKKVKEWIEWLKERRNYIAHEAGVQHTPILKEKELKMTAEEVERKIDLQTDWALLKSMLPQVLYQAQRQMVENIVRMDDFDEVAADAMIVKGRMTDKMFFPLKDIDFDYSHFQDLTKSTLEQLDS